MDLKISDEERRDSQRKVLCGWVARYTRGMQPWNLDYGTFVENCVKQMAKDPDYADHIEKEAQRLKDAKKAQEAKEGGGKTQSR